MRLLWTVRYRLAGTTYCITMEGADRAEIYAKLTHAYADALADAQRLGYAYHVDVLSIEPKD